MDVELSECNTCQEITVMKTEVVEESYDCQTSNDMEFINVKEEPSTIHPTTNFTQLSNVDSELWRCKYEEEEIPADTCEGVSADQEVYVCPFCNVEIFDEKSYRQHVNCCKKNDLRLLGRKDLNFQKYTYATISKSALKRRIFAKNDATKKYKCDTCEYSSSSKGNLKAHIRTHTNERPFKCTYKKKCKCNPKEICECGICEYAAARKGHLKIHMLLQHSGETKKYKCEDCEYSTHTTSHLRSHILQRHSGETKKYNCADCQFSTHSKGDLIIHIRIHTNEKPYKCTYKDCNCAQKESCECAPCGYATARSGSLKMHILTKHSGETKRYECKYCEYSAHIRKYLINHMRIHTNEKPFKCTYKNCKCALEESCQCVPCEYSASRKGILKMHVLTKHSAETKKYECGDCAFSTHRKASLVVHVRIHTNEKPFKCTYKQCTCILESCGCDTCNFTTTRRYSLRRHIKLKHTRNKERNNSGGSANIPFAKEESKNNLLNKV